MSDETLSFNLVDEPWVRVRTLAGKEVELSLLEVFRQASTIERLANDLPTQDFAILRMLLAILQRSIMERLDDCEFVSDAWGDLWDVGELPIDKIEAYLGAWHHRLDLFDSEMPFMQVAGLHAVNNSISEVKKLIADVPDGTPLFSIKALGGLDYFERGEAARWLVHVHAFDTSGIKTGVVGDASVKGGKSYPIGTGWAGNLGGVYLEGSNLTDTLLLNLVLCIDCQELDDEPISEDDLPTWEQPPKEPGDDLRVPQGYADLYTWQSRRVLLCHDEVKVTGVILTNGDKLDAYNKVSIEPMTSWRRSQNQEKKLGIVPVYLPRTHSIGKAIWRGLTSILPQMDTDEHPGAQPPGIMRWVGRLSSIEGGYRLSKDYVLKTHAVGLVYGTQNSVVTELVDDEMFVHAFLLSKEGRLAASLAKRCMKNTEEAVERALGNYVMKLRLAAGDESKRAEGVRDLAKAQAYFELDAPFRSWLFSLEATTDLVQAEDRWNRQAYEIVRAIAQRLVEEAGPEAVVGRKVKFGKAEEWISVGRAENQFVYWLGKTLPYAKESIPQMERES